MLLDGAAEFRNNLKCPFIFENRFHTSTYCQIKRHAYHGLGLRYDETVTKPMQLSDS